MNLVFFPQPPPPDDGTTTGSEGTWGGCKCLKRGSRLVRPGWSWRAHARRSPTHKVIRRPRLPPCGQLGLRDHTTADNPTLVEHCRARIQIRAVGARTLPSVCSDLPSRILPRAAPCRQGRCAQQPRVGAQRESRASPATRLECHPAAIPGTTGDASRGSPVGSGARPPPLPRLKAALRGAGSSYLAAVPGRAGRSGGAGL